MKLMTRGSWDVTSGLDIMFGSLCGLVAYIMLSLIPLLSLWLFVQSKSLSSRLQVTDYKLQVDRYELVTIIIII